MSTRKRIVVKIGTSTLTAGSSKLHLPRIVALARQISSLIMQGNQLVLVTSGAIAVGRERLGYPDLPKAIPAKQMLAAVGQPRLMNVYEQMFEIYGVNVAQILLTREDISDRRRYLNARNTLESLLGQGVLPVVNENDTVATEEIRIGDNDNLSALVANLIEADLLILLTDQEGLFSADPRRSQNARLIREIKPGDFPEDLWEAAGGSRNGLGTGGMTTKLQAADIARRSGTLVVIARGDLPDIVERLVKGEEHGTRILPMVDKLESRKRFMLAVAAEDAWIEIDSGAASAIRSGGSLLPVGVKNCGGEFERGDIVYVKNLQGKVCALGVTNYGRAEVDVIKKRHSDEIESILGYAYGDEIIHHNNMTVLGGSP